MTTRVTVYLDRFADHVERIDVFARDFGEPEILVGQVTHGQTNDYWATTNRDLIIREIARERT